MGLETLVAEIRSRGEAELKAVEEARDTEAASIAADRDAKIRAVREATQHAAELEVARERSQRIAGAKLKARKLLYEAREARLEASLTATRALLADYTRSDAYPAVLKRMVDAATDTLGKSVKVRGRGEDAAGTAEEGSSFGDAHGLLLPVAVHAWRVDQSRETRHVLSGFATTIRRPQRSFQILLEGFLDVVPELVQEVAAGGGLFGLGGRGRVLLGLVSRGSRLGRRRRGGRARGCGRRRRRGRGR